MEKPNICPVCGRATEEEGTLIYCESCGFSVDEEDRNNQEPKAA